MDRKAAHHSIDRLNNYRHYTIDAYRDITKLIQYILYEIDQIKERETEPPSIYGSMMEEPNYRDFPDDKSDHTVELEDVVLEEEVLADIEVSYIDDTTIPLVLASNAMMTPFRALPTEEPAESAPSAEDPIKEPNPKQSGESAPTDEITWAISKTDLETVTVRPKRLRVLGETDKTSLHNGGLKRVKENLKEFKKNKKVINIDGAPANN